MILQLPAHCTPASSSPPGLVYFSSKAKIAIPLAIYSLSQSPMPSRTSLLSVGGSSSPPFPSTYLGEGDIIPHVMDTQKGSYNPSKPPTRSSRTYSVPVEGPIGPPYYNTCHSEGDIIPLAPVTQKGIDCSSTQPISYYKARNTPQSIATALEHLEPPRKLDAT